MASLASSLRPEYNRGRDNLSLVLGAYPSRRGLETQQYELDGERFERVVKPSTHLSKYLGEFEQRHKRQVCHSGQTSIKL